MSMTKRDVERCAQFLQQNDQYLIGTHRRPDGDTVGSAAALCRALRQLGKTAYVLENTQITPRYAPYLAEYLRPAGWEPAHVICVDVADESMLSPNPECYENRTDLVIDHHGSNPGFGRINLIEPGYAAAAELVYEVILALGVPLDEQMALAIYLGVATDTGGFHYSNTTVHSHLVAADCMRFDQIDFGKLNLHLFEIKTRARLYLEERIIRTLEFRMDGRLTVAAITRRDREETGVTWTIWSPSPRCPGRSREWRRPSPSSSWRGRSSFPSAPICIWTPPPSAAGWAGAGTCAPPGRWCPARWTRCAGGR